MYASIVASRASSASWAVPNWVTATLSGSTPDSVRITRSSTTLACVRPITPTRCPASSSMPLTLGAKKPAPKVKGIDELAGHRVGVIGRTQANVVLLRVILTESGVDPDKVAVTQFGTAQLAELARDATIDAYMAVGPLDSKITSEAIALTAKARGEPKFLPIDVSEAIAQRHPLYEAEEIPGSTFASSPARPEDKIDTVSVNHLIVARKSLSETSVAGFVRQLFTVRPQIPSEVPA